MRRVGIVGFGSIAEHAHLPAWQAFDDVDVVAIADLSPERQDRARELLPDAMVYDTSHDLIRHANVDCLDICSPPSTHVDLIQQACLRGILDIICEKPFVLSEAEYLRVARAREMSGARIVSVNNWMYSGLNRCVTACLSNHAIGAIESVKLSIGRPDCALGNESWMPRWRLDRTYSGGGIILDHGWHQVYLVLGWMDAPLDWISAVTRTVDHRHYPVEDEAVIRMNFPTAQGHIDLSWTAGDRTNEGFIQGTRGNITLLDDRIVIENHTRRYDVPFGGKISQSSYHPEWFQSLFLSTILDTHRIKADQNFAEAGVLISVISAAYQSAQEHGAPCRPTFPTRESVAAALREELVSVHGGCQRGASA